MGPRRVDAWWRWRDDHVLVTLGSTGSSFALNQIAGAVFESCTRHRSITDVELEAGRLVGRPLGEGTIARALAELARAGLVVVDGHRDASPPASSSALTPADILGVPVVEPVPAAAFLPSGHASGAHTPRALGVTRCGVRIVVVDETGVDLPDMLPDGTGLEPDEEVAADVRYVIRTPADLSPWPEVERTRGEECLRVVGMVGRAELMGWLSRDLDESVALCSRAGVVARAGAVTWRGHAVLVTNQGGPGPSPLVAELVRLGATRHAERVALLDDEGRVHPSGGGRASTPLRPTLIVAMRYDRGAPWSPHVVRGAEAVLPVLGCAPGARRDPRRSVQLVARLAAAVTTLAGAMPAAAVAAPHVLRTLDDIIDDRPSVIPSPVPDTRTGNLLGPEDRPEGFTAARYVAVDDFLEPDDHARVLAFACGQEASFETSQVMARASSKVDTEVRKSRTLFSQLSPIWGMFEDRLRQVLPFVRSELGAPWFPLGRIERQLTAHQEGGLFAIHVDNGEPALAGRRITCVYYFHGTPRRFSGGELRVYDSAVEGGRIVPAATYQVVESRNNRAVFFASDTHHEVRPVHCDSASFRDSRFAVNVWFWTGKRVARPDEAAGMS